MHEKYLASCCDKKNVCYYSIFSKFSKFKKFSKFSEFNEFSKFRKFIGTFRDSLIKIWQCCFRPSA